jgi:hypothetical protein
MRYFLEFKNDGYGKKQIDEPIGFSDTQFSLKQKTDGGKMGRDVSFTADFEFTNLRDHQLEKLLYYHKRFGYESNVVLTAEIDENNTYKCDLDFAESETDGLTHFKCKGIEDNKLQIIKARKSVKVDLFNDIDVDGNFILPLQPQNLLIKAKPVFQTSKWEQPIDYDRNLSAQGDTTTVIYAVNPCLNIVSQSVEDTFTFFDDTDVVDVSFEGRELESLKDAFLVTRAKNNQKNILVNISDLNINLETDVDNGGNGFVDFSLEVHFGATPETATKRILLQTTLTENQNFSFIGNKFTNIDSLNRGDSIWIYYRLKVRQSATSPIGSLVPRFECFTKISRMKTEIIVEATSFNTIANSFRLVDVMRQVIKSISGLEINAPQFELGGMLYDNFLTSGNLIRGITDKGFKISLEDLERSFGEFKGDYEIGTDGKVFFGIEREFYTNIESGFFDNTQFDELTETFNDEFKVNEFSFAYKKYQSQKENELLNSKEIIHGQSKYVFFNKNVENKKEITIEWIRDPFMLSLVQSKAIEINEQTSSQDDLDIFAIDTIAIETDLLFNEVYTFQHSYDESNGGLILRSDNTVNFSVLGIAVESLFYIKTPDINAGTYRVLEIQKNQINLERVLGIVTSAGNGIRQTAFTYTLSKDLVPFQNYTDEGFTETENLNGGQNFANRRYSIARNINNFWKDYISTANLYHPDRPVRNTEYIHNENYKAKFNGITLREKDDLIYNTPLLSPKLFNKVIFKDVYFEDFILLQNNIRSQRGYIRAIDNNENVVKLYPTSLEYSILDKQLEIQGKEKYEPVNMTISTEFEYILINNETRVLRVIAEIVDDKLFIYDENRFRLYNGVYWFNVSINGAIPNSIAQLKDWLSLLN